MHSSTSTILFSIPGRYANALIDEKFQSFIEDFQKSIQTLTHDPVCERILNSKHLNKKHLIPFMDTFGKILQLSETFITFLKVLITENRLKLLPEIYRCYKILWDTKNNQQDVSVHSVLPFNENEKQKITHILESQYQKKLSIKYHEKKELLGGFLIEIGNLYIDASLLHQLNKITETIEVL